tara:strand:- start:620 stop:1069 length:450 start_codon:yes stop_codon:yes gene_type:complete
MEQNNIKKLISSLFSTLILMGVIISIIFVNKDLEYKEQLSKQTIQIHSDLWVDGKQVDCKDYMKNCLITCEEDNYRTGDCYYDEFGVTSITYLTCIAIIVLLLDCITFSMKKYRYRYLVVQEDSSDSQSASQSASQSVSQEYTSLKCSV